MPRLVHPHGTFHEAKYLEPGWFLHRCRLYRVRARSRNPALRWWRESRVPLERATARSQRGIAQSPGISEEVGNAQRRILRQARQNRWAVATTATRATSSSGIALRAASRSPSAQIGEAAAARQNLVRPHVAADPADDSLDVELGLESIELLLHPPQGVNQRDRRLLALEDRLDLIVVLRDGQTDCGEVLRSAGSWLTDRQLRETYRFPH